MRKWLLVFLTLATSLPVFPAGCATTTTPYPGYSKTGVLDRMGNSVKSGSQKITAMVSPKSKPGVDAEIQPTGGKPGPHVYVAAAQMSERAGNLPEAEIHYKKALEIDPNNLRALLGYAHLHDRQNDFEGATKLYQKALKKHPKEASAHNDIGLCYHRRAMLPEATRHLQRAVELQPDQKLYRDNLAAALVEQGKTSEALVQLTTAHGEAVGNYNLGYLLTQKKDNAGAMRHFRVALAKDPSLAAAQQWIATLSRQPQGFGPQGGPTLVGGSVPAAPPAQVNTNTSYAAPPTADANPQVAQVRTADNVPYVAQRPAAQSEARRMQFPQFHSPVDSAADAVPPLPDQMPVVR